MTPIADMVAQMIDAGVPRDVIVLAVRTVELAGRSTGIPPESPVDIAAEKRRAYDRDRKRVHRNSTGIPPESAECPVAAISILEDKNTKKENKNSRGSRISAEWQPNENHFLEGSRLGFDRSKVESFAHDMRLWAEANSHRPIARKADWDKTFTGWLRRQKPGEAPPQTATPPPKQAREFPKISQDLIEKFAVWWTPAIPESVPPEQWQSFQQEFKKWQS